MSRRKPTTSTSSFAATTYDTNPEEETTKPQKQHSLNFPTFHYMTMDGQDFAVRGATTFGLLIGPGAAFGLVCSDTWLQLMDRCVRPAGKEDGMTIDHNKVVPVSGINGVSESTLGQVTLPLTSGGHQIIYNYRRRAWRRRKFLPCTCGQSCLARNERSDFCKLV